MKRVFVGAALAITVSLGMVASAQSTGQPPQSPPQSPPATAQAPAQQPMEKAPAQDVIIVGCVQREDDYRKAHNLGKGGAAGTGVGSGDEFVLINASIQGAGATATGATGTSGGTSEGTAFELTGDQEDSLKPFVGKRVEITGKMKAAEKGAAGPTGGATAGTPPTGVDVVSKDLRLREVDVVSVKESTSGTCPAMK